MPAFSEPRMRRVTVGATAGAVPRDQGLIEEALRSCARQYRRHAESGKRGGPGQFGAPRGRNCRRAAEQWQCLCAEHHSGRVLAGRRHRRLPDPCPGSAARSAGILAHRAVPGQDRRAVLRGPAAGAAGDPPGAAGAAHAGGRHRGTEPDAGGVGGDLPDHRFRAHPRPRGCRQGPVDTFPRRAAVILRGHHHGRARRRRIHGYQPVAAPDLGGQGHQGIHVRCLRPCLAVAVAAGRALRVRRHRHGLHRRQVGLRRAGHDASVGEFPAHGAAVFNGRTG